MPRFAKRGARGPRRWSSTKAFLRGTAKRPNVRTLSRKITRVAKRDAPRYYVCDDVLSDTAGLITVSTTMKYRYFGLYFGAGATDTNFFGTQGNNEGDIRGNAVRVHSLTVRGTVFLQSTTLFPTPDYTNIVRVIWFWDRDAASYKGGVVNNNFPLDTDNLLLYYNGTPTTAAGNGSCNGFYNIQNVGRGKRFQILADNRYSLCASGVTQRLIYHKLKLGGRSMGVPLAAPGGAALAQNVGCMMISDSLIGPFPAVTWNMRMCYST